MSTPPPAPSRALSPAVDTPAAAARSVRRRRPVLLAGLVCALSFACFVAAQQAAQVSMIDLSVYRAEGWAARTGQDLYALRATEAELPATYPPFAALLFVPLTYLDVPLMRALAVAGNLALLVAVVHLSLRLLGRPHRVPAPALALLVAAGAVWCEPVWTTLRYGQVNLLVAVLVLGDLTRRPGHRWAGAGIGVAAGIKLTPGLFGVLLLVWGLAGRDAGRLRQAAVATGAFLASAAGAALVLPRDSWRFWTDAVFTAGRVGNPEDVGNQSLHGVLARLLHTGDPGTPALAASVLAGLLGLAVAVAAGVAGPERLPYAPAWAALSCAVTALLVSPFSWSHHWVWCVPAVLLLAADARDRGARPWAPVVAGAVFCGYAIWAVPHSSDRADRLELRLEGWETALSALYPLCGAAFLALAGTRAVRALRAPAQATQKE